MVGKGVDVDMASGCGARPRGGTFCAGASQWARCRSSWCWAAPADRDWETVVVFWLQASLSVGQCVRRRGGTRAALRLDDVVLLFPGQFRETTGRQAESGDGSEVKWTPREAEKQHTTTLLLPGATRPAVRRGVEGWASTTTTLGQSTAIPLIWLRSQWSPRFRPNAMHRQYEVVQHAGHRSDAKHSFRAPSWALKEIYAIHVVHSVDCIRAGHASQETQHTLHMHIPSHYMCSAKVVNLRLMNLCIYVGVATSPVR